MSKRTTWVNKEIAFMGIMAAIVSLLLAYMSGGFTRLMLAAIIGVLVFKTIAKAITSSKFVFKNFCMVLCAATVLLMTGKSDGSAIIVIYGMILAGSSGAYAIYHKE